MIYLVRILKQKTWQGSKWVNFWLENNRQIEISGTLIRSSLTVPDKSHGRYIIALYINSRRLVGSTDQACSSGLYILQYCMKINGTTFFSLKLFPVIPAGPQKYKHKIGHNYFTFQNPKKFQFSKQNLPQKLLLFQWLKKCL